MKAEQRVAAPQQRTKRNAQRDSTNRKAENNVPVHAPEAPQAAQGLAAPWHKSQSVERPPTPQAKSAGPAQASNAQERERPQPMPPYAMELAHPRRGRADAARRRDADPGDCSVHDGLMTETAATAGADPTTENGSGSANGSECENGSATRRNHRHRRRHAHDGGGWSDAAGDAAVSGPVSALAPVDACDGEQTLRHPCPRSPPPQGHHQGAQSPPGH